MRVGQSRSLVFAVGTPVEELAVEKGAGGVRGDEYVVHPLAVDALRTRASLPVCDEILFVQESFGAQG